MKADPLFQEEQQHLQDLETLDESLMLQEAADVVDDDCGSYYDSKVGDDEDQQ